MNVLLWTVQMGLALLYVAGGAYKTVMVDELARHVAAVPGGAWRAFGLVEVVGGLLLAAPAVTRALAGLTPLVAAVLTVETLLLAALYARSSWALTASNPLPWAVAMAVLAGVVAVGRYASA